MTTGICNEVYTAVLKDREVIVRLSSVNNFLMGSHNNIPLLNKLGIKVPEILAEDYSKTLIPYSYQIQNKIQGKDIGDVIETLSPEQLKLIAKEISNIINKFKTIPTSNKFGVVWGEEVEFGDTWTERMELWVKETIERGRQTGVMDDKLQGLVEKLLSENKNYFATVAPQPYFGDMSSKNVMVHNGVFNGLVDLDGYTQGDFLEGVSRIQASWFGTTYGEIYTNALMDEQQLTVQQRKIVALYALLNRISWTCENGIKFNENTTAEVDWKKDEQNKKVIESLETYYNKINC